MLSYQKNFKRGYSKEKMEKQFFGQKRGIDKSKKKSKEKRCRKDSELQEKLQLHPKDYFKKPTHFSEN